MFRFLSSLFPATTRAIDDLDQALIDAAIERAVQVTDRRLRALSGYRKQLQASVECSVRHALAIVDHLPAPTEISQQAFGKDPQLQAFFVSNEHLAEVLGQSREMRIYLEACASPPPEGLVVLLSMAMEERTILGMELKGDVIRRDVLQTGVNFLGHHFICPAATESDARWELKKRAFDFLLQIALQRLVEEKTRRIDLDRQWHLLRQKLAAMRAGSLGLDSLFDNDADVAVDLAELEAEIETIETELKSLGTQTLALEDSLESVNDTLSRPSEWLNAQEIRLNLDYRGIKLANPAPSNSREVRLLELSSSRAQTRIVFFGRVPISEIPKQSGFLKKVLIH